MEPVARAFGPDSSAELELLLACGRRAGKDQDAVVEGLLRRKLNWDTVIARAVWHGLVPLLAARLAASALVPQPVQHTLRRLYTQALLQNVKLTNELIEVLGALAARGIVAVPFKGPAQAQRLYGDLALRQSADIDVLIRKQDVLAAIETTRALGFASALAISDHHLPALADADFELWLRRDTTHLELHWETIPRFYGIRFGLDEAWPRLRRAQFDNTEIYELAPEDLFLALALHGSKHLWAKLIWSLDLARLVENNSGFNWPLLMTQARTLRVERLLLASIRIASELFALVVPSEIQRQCERPEIAPLVKRAYANMVSQEPQLEGWRNYWFFLCARDKWSDRVRQLARHALTPGPGDWAHMPGGIPPAVYLPIHVLRLCGRLAKFAGKRALAPMFNLRKPPDAAPQPTKAGGKP